MVQSDNNAPRQVEELIGSLVDNQQNSSSTDNELDVLDIEDVDYVVADSELIRPERSLLLPVTLDLPDSSGQSVQSTQDDTVAVVTASPQTVPAENQDRPVAGLQAALPLVSIPQAQPEDAGLNAVSSLSERKRNGKPVIVLEHVSKVYPAQPNRPALANISLEVYPGEFIFLVGHSGSGKSTFIRLLNRELVATSGRITVAGENLNRLRRWRVPYLRRNIGCVFQDYKLLPNKTAYHNVAFALEVIGKSRHIIRAQVPEVLRLVGLEDKLDMLPDQLSGGEQQRVCIARAIVNRPPLLICDEPTGNLDPQTSLGIMRLLDRINRTGTTVLVATHDREMVDSMRKRVLELENGYLVRDQDRGVYGLDG